MTSVSFALLHTTLCSVYPPLHTHAHTHTLAYCTTHLSTPTSWTVALPTVLFPWQVVSSSHGAHGADPVTDHVLPFVQPRTHSVSRSAAQLAFTPNAHVDADAQGAQGTLPVTTLKVPMAHGVMPTWAGVTVVVVVVVVVNARAFGTKLSTTGALTVIEPAAMAANPVSAATALLLLLPLLLLLLLLPLPPTDWSSPAGVDIGCGATTGVFFTSALKNCMTFAASLT